MEFIVLSLVPRTVGSCWQPINSGWKYVIIFHLLLQIHSAPFSQCLVWTLVDSSALWIQPVQKEEGHLEDGRTAKSEYLFHRLFPAKLLQIYPVPRSEKHLKKVSCCLNESLLWRLWKTACSLRQKPLWPSNLSLAFRKVRENLDKKMPMKAELLNAPHSTAEKFL